MKTEAKKEDLCDRLKALARRVAELDDAGLDVHAKSAIAEARKLAKLLTKGQK